MSKIPTCMTFRSAAAMEYSFQDPEIVFTRAVLSVGRSAAIAIDYPARLHEAHQPVCMIVLAGMQTDMSMTATGEGSSAW